MKTHTRQVTVSPEHLDSISHVNNVQYVRWVEEIAAEHWELLKHSTKYADDYWVLLDHHIQYKKQVFLNDVITIKTYPERPEGIRQPRKVEFYRQDELVVDSRTLWILIDRGTQKMKRIEANWLDAFL
jgi:acyl-CoA thioester hydrolase